MDLAQEKLTPMMKQFVELKTQYSDCILLFRAGDFYETFFEDAKVASQVLGITLTKRGSTPMAGVPFHSINPYIKKLVQQNFKVALCEQLEDPKKAKGLVKRGVTRVITPGTILEDEFLSSNQNNFIMSIYGTKQLGSKFGASLVDITTGEFYCLIVEGVEDLISLIEEYSPQELVINDSFYNKKLFLFIENKSLFYSKLSDVRFNEFYAKEILKKQFSFSTKEMGIDSQKEAVISSGALLFYIYKLQKLDLSHINSLKYITYSSKLILDAISLRNLEITQSLYSKDSSKTLFGILDNCKTSFGSRLLKKMISSPMIDIKELESQYDAIQESIDILVETREVRELLTHVYDIERITSRISSRLVSPKDLYALMLSLEKLPELKQVLLKFQSSKIKSLRSFSSFDEIYKILKNAIKEDAPAHTRDLGYLNPQFDSKLLELYNITFNSKDFIAQFELEQKKELGISTLKVKYNRVFGYYIEIPSSQKEKVPQEYILRQTLANNFRYTTPLLKEKEEIILGSQEKMKALERDLFDELVSQLRTYVKSFQDLAQKLAYLDVYLTHGLNAQLYNYSRPSLHETTSKVVEGRNPIVERFSSNYIPNDIYFDEEETFKVVTGPNMAGKSTYLRQAALLSIMAQSGSFVAAKSAQLKVYDRIFTRIGAHDELASGESTFMVEMSETANILVNASKDSLIVLDEIGRGTSTYDGLAIAWAITEDLAKKGAHSIFATHYHQLNLLSEYFSSIENYHVLIREEGEKIEFLHKIVKGATDKSYGLYVGKLAGIPLNVLERAKEIQTNIEEKETIVISKQFKHSLELGSKSKKKETPHNLDSFLKKE